MPSPTVLLISGSTREGSVSAAAIASVAALLPAGSVADVYDGLLELPHFVPDHDPDRLPPAVADLRRRIARCDAIVVSTPEYAGSMPAGLKNLLEWTVGGDEIEDKPSGWINPSTSPSGAADTYRGLAATLGYTGARLVDAACVAVPIGRRDVGDDGTIENPAARAAIAGAVAALLAAVDRP